MSRKNGLFQRWLRSSKGGLASKFIGFLLLLALVAIVIVQVQNRSEQNSTNEIKRPATSQIEGRKFARTYCQSCHKLPDPELLDKQMWKQVVLPRMGHRLGIYRGGERPDSLFEVGISGKIERVADIYPKQAVLSRQKWEKLSRTI